MLWNRLFDGVLFGWFVFVFVGFLSLFILFLVLF